MNWRIARKILKEIFRAFEEDIGPTTKYSILQLNKAIAINYKHQPKEVKETILEIKRMDNQLII